MSNSNNLSNRSILGMTLGIIILIWSVFWISVTAFAWSEQLESKEMLIYYQPTAYQESDFNFWNLLWSYHTNFIHGILAIIGGIGLLRRKNYGWSVSLAVGILQIIHFSWLYSLGAPADIANLMLLFTVGQIALFSIVSLMLFLPNIRKEYSANLKNTIPIMIIIVLAILDEYML